ncbi:bifunctional DNA primase/polymerase [Thermus sp. NMX2.A1]|uniref:bifunctional DNA primase/polymerase n=1 Tax=Thermus sp. NMX2.A1 TaxID=570924 RepID=UPI00041E85D3|nr:bifunctional DNA primase/polymerase [Thermus sp. NMX2.A1]
MKKEPGRPAPTARLVVEVPKGILPQAGGRALEHRASRYEAALAYACLGYRVLPLHPGEKRPHGGLVPHGLKEASREEAVIRAWWTREPGAGVGILAPEEVLVLDVDQAEVWERLKEAHPALLEAPRQRTPKGGVHVFLKLPPGLEGALSATVRRLEGVDLRGMGRAYVVAAPTRLADGREYRWEVPLVSPEGLPLVPQGLLEALLPPPPPREVRTGEASPKRLRALLEAYADRVASAPQGTRHNTLIAYARAAGGLLPHGLDPHEAEEVLVAAAMQAGLPEREARAATRWGLEAGARAPLPLEDQGDFGPKGAFWAKGLAQNPAPSWTAKTRFRANEAPQYKDPNPWGEEGGAGWG